MKKRKIKPLLLLLVFAAGVGTLLYPTVSARVNAAHQSAVVEQYRAAIREVPQEAVEQNLKSAQEYNRLVHEELGNRLGKLSPELEERYREELDWNGNGVMGYISIPRIRVSLPIRHGTEEEVLTGACGHLTESSLPVGGESTHAVLSGHRGLPSSKLFTDLDQLAEGDTFYLHMAGEVLAYRIDQIKTILPEQTDDLAIVEGKDYVTLMTCTPYGINTHRLLLRGSRIPYVPEEEASVEPVREMNRVAALTGYLVAGAIVLALVLIVLIPCYYRWKYRKGAK